jgi:hypothetical protein
MFMFPYKIINGIPSNTIPSPGNVNFGLYISNETQIMLAAITYNIGNTGSQMLCSAWNIGAFFA